MSPLSCLSGFPQVAFLVKFHVLAKMFQHFPWSGLTEKEGDIGNGGMLGQWALMGIEGVFELLA